ncbi:unnamed protein product [Paramecium pentaurelia]|uniref:Uncharacterized protein n=1 Tax=Paramecium pentaurelia TaxID=43138 RepID=A0A8S1U660_9CILI|nr:unnamed protein product [Paramecium pentaurelia]
MEFLHIKSLNGLFINHGCFLTTRGLKNYQSKTSVQATNIIVQQQIFELPLHNQINLSFMFWMQLYNNQDILNSSSEGFEFHLYVDNQIISVFQTSLYSLINSS